MTRRSSPEPLIDWDSLRRPLPVRLIRAHSHRHPGPPEFNPALVSTGAASAPFDFCGHIRSLCAAVVTQIEAFYHINLDRVLFGVTVARNRRLHGLQARVTPMRFAHGEMTRRIRGLDYQVQRFRHDGREILYLMTFCLPRFLNQSFHEKMVTVFHELFHISPAFDGDLRRHEGRYSVHSHSQKEYDQEMANLVRQYLNGRADPRLHAFLRLDFAQLHEKHQGVIGVMLPRPRIFPVPSVRSAARY